jgi:hypothetical protein
MIAPLTELPWKIGGSYFSNAGHLVDLLGNIAALEDGAALCEIAQRKYTWDIVRKQYVKLFLTFG